MQIRERRNNATESDIRNYYAEQVRKIEMEEDDLIDRMEYYKNLENRTMRKVFIYGYFTN